MSPFPPLLQPVIIQLIFFFSSPPRPLPFPPAAPVIAVITIYLGSLFHYTGAAEKTRGKVLFYDLWRLFDLRLLEGSTDVMPLSEMDYELWLGAGTEEAAFKGRWKVGGVSADWKTNSLGQHRRRNVRGVGSTPTFHSSRCHVGSIGKSRWGRSGL